MFKKILGFIMAGVITVTFSLSAVAEEAFVDEAVTEEIVTVEDGLDVDHVCTDDHDHSYGEVLDVYAGIMATAGCPHSMVVVGTGSGSRTSGPHWFSTGEGLASCGNVTEFNYTNYMCINSGCGYTSRNEVVTRTYHNNSRCPG